MNKFKGLNVEMVRQQTNIFMYFIFNVSLTPNGTPYKITRMTRTGNVYHFCFKWLYEYFMRVKIKTFVLERRQTETQGSELVQMKLSLSVGRRLTQR